MTRNLFLVVVMLAFGVPFASFLLGGEPITEAPASVTYYPPAHSAVEIPPSFVGLSNEYGLVPVPDVRIAASPENPCAGRGPECEGEARTALPGPEWQTYMTLEALKRDFEDACRDWTRGAEDRRAEIRAKARSFAAPYALVCVKPTVDAYYRATFCDPWSC